MITSLRILNFKSLEDFHLPGNGNQDLAPLTILVGLNGSGKSTVLQALGFIGQLMCGRVRDWLAVREWQPSDLVTAWSRSKRAIDITLNWKDPDCGLITWEARYNVDKGRTTSETVSLYEASGDMIPDEILSYSRGQLMLANPAGELERRIDGTLSFEGSVLSVLSLGSKEHPALTRLKDGLLGLQSLELLSPHLMRRKARASDNIGRGGETLAAFLSCLDATSLKSLNDDLRSFYPHLNSLTIKSLRAGWKNLVISENYRPSSEFGATHVNDGMLRVVAVLAQTFADHSVVLFDEIENGVNQQIVQRLISFLISLSQKKQVFVTTHSPLILNYLPDNEARKGVIFLYKDNTGATNARRFFDLDETEWKLSALGPGEVLADTDLMMLTERLAKLKGAEA